MKALVPEHKLPKNAEVAYLCKHKAKGVVCPESKCDMACYEECYRTTNIEHAKEPKGERMFDTYDGEHFFEVER